MVSLILLCFLSFSIQDAPVDQSAKIKIGQFKGDKEIYVNYVSDNETTSISIKCKPEDEFFDMMFTADLKGFYFTLYDCKEDSFDTNPIHLCDENGNFVCKYKNEVQVSGITLRVGTTLNVGRYTDWWTFTCKDEGEVYVIQNTADKNVDTVRNPLKYFLIESEKYVCRLPDLALKNQSLDLCDANGEFICKLETVVYEGKQVFVEKPKFDSTTKVLEFKCPAEDSVTIKIQFEGTAEHNNVTFQVLEPDSYCSKLQIDLLMSMDKTILCDYDGVFYCERCLLNEFTKIGINFHLRDQDQSLNFTRAVQSLEYECPDQYPIKGMKKEIRCHQGEITPVPKCLRRSKGAKLGRECKYELGQATCVNYCKRTIGK